MKRKKEKNNGGLRAVRNLSQGVVIRTICFLLMFSVLSLSVPFSFEADAEALSLFEQIYGDNPPEAIVTDFVYYTDYLRDITELDANAKDYAGEKITSSVTNAAATPRRGNQVQKSEDGKDVINWSNEYLESLSWDITVPEDAFYNIELEYLPLRASNMPPQRSLRINGELLFEEMRIFSFHRLFVDEYSEFRENELKDQVRPPTVEASDWSSVRLRDSQGDYYENLRFYLTKGTHKIEFLYNSGPLLVSSVSLAAPVQYKSYEEALAEYKSNGYTEYTGDFNFRINTELPLSKSDSSLRAQASNDPNCDPPNEGYTVYNTIGARSWGVGNSTVTWAIKDVPQDGLYKLSMRYYQDYTNGLPVYRKIEINGEVPHKDFLCFKIDKADWTERDIVSRETGEPYLVKLNKGDNTLSMTTMRGEGTEVIIEMKKTSYMLAELVQKIRKITTGEPDTNFDYRLEVKIPGLIDDLRSVSASIEDQINVILGIATSKPGAINTLKMTKLQIDRMIADPFIIARGLSGLNDAQSNMAQWISDFQDCSMEIDFIEVKSPSAKTVDSGSSIWKRIVSVFRNFFLSFYREYDMVSSGDVEGAEKIELWVSRPKEWSEVLQSIIKEEFSPTYNTNVEMSVVPAGAFSTSGILMLAIASGTAPDVALGAGAGVPFEYGTRDGVADLTAFKSSTEIINGKEVKLNGYDEVAKRFLPGIMVPFRHKDKIFALPETMDFNVLYYRTDILKSLNINVPNTWDQLNSTVVPILKKNSMNFYYDGAVAAVAGAVPTAFHSLLLQNGGAYYTEDGLKSALDRPESLMAFKQFTEMHTIQGMPVDLNFYMRFRTGEVPIGVSSFNTFIMLTASAPEITGKWDVAAIPGIEQEDGQINRAYGGNTQGAIIMEASNNKQAAWNFLDWYTSSNVQTRYANEMTAAIGPEARWCSANLESFDDLSWETNLKKAVVTQRDWYWDMPNVIGGYITPRFLENARVGVVVQKRNYRDSLEKVVKSINLELVKKNEEFAKRAEFEAAREENNKEG
ncbi:MAG: extracellular solute-binding protein [Oscillospiraceae bacterium]|nr:extracellular solute-binding protein [Oscillospiraceae bacterium]